MFRHNSLWRIKYEYARAFPQLDANQPLVGIAKLASEGVALAQGHDVDYFMLENRSLLTRCVSKRVPFRWMINPYRGCEFGCKYCYARYTHELMELRNSLDFERKIFVKQRVAWLLRQELKQVCSGEAIAIGTATDPYQPAERKFGVTRAILEELARHRGLDIGLVTKGTLILRDRDLLQAVAANNGLSICITVTTMNTQLARILEPRAPCPDLRLKVVRQLTDAGIRTGVNCAPVLPGITDSLSDLETLVRESAVARAGFIFSNGLFLKPCSQKVLLPFVEEKFPSLLPLYRARYSSNAFLPAEYNRRISALVKKYCAKYGITGDRRLTSDATRASEKTSARPQQLNLFQYGIAG